MRGLAPRTLASTMHLSSSSSSSMLVLVGRATPSLKTNHCSLSSEPARATADENAPTATSSSTSSVIQSTATATTSSSTTTATTTTITYRGQVLDKAAVPRGTKLRTALLVNGVSPHNGRSQLINCRGLGTCGTCAVEIKGDVLPTSWTAAEQLRLNFPPHKAPNNQRLRLACQVSCAGPELEVIKRDRFWGQGDVVLGPATGPGEYSLPLGELEFLLDQQGRKELP